MEARQMSMEDFLSSNKTRFIIPVYQRNYDWKEKNCLQLFEDIKNAGVNENIKSHFMGSIVYVSNSDTDSIDLKEYVIIDGQQRVTTTTLFLKALHDVIEDELVKEEIIETYLTNKRLDEINKLKLKPIKKDDEVYTKLLKNDFDTIDKDSNIYKNYIFFKNKIMHFNDYKTLIKGFKKLFMVHIALNRRDDNPQLIFESINSTGVSLSQSDLIRNFLLMDKEALDQKRLFEDFWFKIEENLSSENISNFVRDYLTMKQNKISNKDEVYESFKKFVFENNISSTEDLLMELLEYSKIYKTFLYPKDEVYAQNLKNLKQLKIGVVYPFLLPVVEMFNKNEIDKNNLFDVLKTIESYVIRRAICNKPTNALNKVFGTIYNDILEIQNFDKKYFSKYFNTILISKKGSAIFPNDEDFKSDFTTKDSYSLKSINFILYRLEHKDNNERLNSSDLITIEHFMPQTLTNAWKLKLGNNYQSIYDNYLHNIGNLSLSGDNSKLGNRTFEEKQDILKDSSRLKLNQFFIDAKNWTDEEIKNRANILFTEAKELWKYPKDQVITLALEYDDKDFYTLDDDADVTGKKPMSFEILGQKYSTSTWRDMYTKVVEVLVEKDWNLAQTFINDSDFQGRQRRLISDSKDDLRSAQKIKDNFFIETNLSANSILVLLKLLCEKFNLTSSDFIFSVKE